MRVAGSERALRSEDTGTRSGAAAHILNLGRRAVNAFTDDPRHADHLHAWQILRLLHQQDNGGTVVALEHDPDWARLGSGLLAQEQLSEFGRVIDAPLAGEPLWYCLDALAELSAGIASGLSGG